MGSNGPIDAGDRDGSPTIVCGMDRRSHRAWQRLERRRAAGRMPGVPPPADNAGRAWQHIAELAEAMSPSAERHHARRCMHGRSLHAKRRRPWLAMSASGARIAYPVAVGCGCRAQSASRARPIRSPAFLHALSAQSGLGRHPARAARPDQRLSKSWPHLDA